MLDSDSYLVAVLEKMLTRLDGLSGAQALEVFKAQGLVINIALPPSVAHHVDRQCLRLYPDEKKLFWKGHGVMITPMEFRVVDLLSRQSEVNWSYRSIYDLITGRPGLIAGGVGGYQVNVRSNIKRIRAKFRAVDLKFDAIRAMSGFGYYWKA